MFHHKAGPENAALTAVALGVAAAIASTSASAMPIDTGNPDLEVQFDNTVRYNLGVRTERRDPRIASTRNSDLGDNKFDKGDIVTNRLDLLTELDVRYKGKYGLRLSGAAWYDHAYDDITVRPSPGNPSEYRGNVYNSTVKRFYRGPSGELLDAFVFGSFDLGPVPVSLKAGKHVVYWGEGLLLGAHAISYSQSPSDGRKALASPGIETKEVFLPINQISGTAQITNDVSLAAQVLLDWKPTRAPSGGTYLSATDVPDVDLVGGALPYRPNLEPTNKKNSYGMFLRWKLSEYNSTLGFYYRQFDDFNPHTLATGAFGARFIHANDVKLYGVSYGTTVAGTAIGAELSFRKGAALNTASVNTTTFEGARGDTMHFVVNAIASLPNTPLWSTGTAVVELAGSRLSKVTREANRYRGVGAVGCTVPAALPAGTDPKDIGCSTRSNGILSVAFTPQYLQVLPGLDLSVPVRLSYGLWGNSPNAGSSGNKGEYTWSVGVVANYQFKHELSLTYADRFQKTVYDAAGTQALAGNGSQFGINDRGFVTVTYKYAF